VRNFKDTHSFRLGAQYQFPVAGYPVEARAGLYYEPSAIPSAYLTPLTTDVDKLSVSLGAGLYVGKNWRFDITYAHVFSDPVTVSPYEAAVPRVTPVQGNPVDSPAVNGGTYTVTAGVLGVGLQYKFGG
jgi:long-subunit fatty acid transport protein